jgi:hypothetical protein
MSFSASSAACGASSCAADCGGGGGSFSGGDSGGDSGIGTSSTVANPATGSTSNYVSEPLSPEEEERRHREEVKKMVWRVKRAKMRWNKVKSQVAEHVFRRKPLA